MREPSVERRLEDGPDGIAIVGLACRFPGAPDAATFWRNVCAGVESISTLDEARLEDAFDASARAQKSFVRARGLLEDVDMFDAAFFGMQPREAEITDPQHRVLLELCWEALEDAGCDPARYPGAIGVYAGCSISSYFLRNVLGERPAIETFASDYQVGSYPALIGSGADFLATRIAYKLDLRGPAMTVQSACSTSLLAVAQAAQALWSRQADVMLAGAVSISFPQQRGYVHQDGGMVSSDGHCRTFDARASGTVFGAGAGVVVLKRLADARRDGDPVYAVLRGIGVNNDGSAKVGFTAPSVEPQAAAISAAQRMAGFAPGTIDYVECHGTATPLGDPIEVAALAKAFGASGAPRSCALGSVKPNVGHLDVAAGMAGLIKTALALHHGKIPPTLHFSAPNPRIDFAATPFYVNAELSDWPRREHRRAGVSAFGVGGTNVHLVLESETERAAAPATAGPHLLVVSARDEQALAAQAMRLAAHLRANPELALDDVAYTLQTGRRAFARRRFVTAATSAQAIAELEGPRPARDARQAGAGDAAIAFMFPGQGSQYAGMGRELYAAYAVFREAVDRCAEIARPLLGCDLRTLSSADGATGMVQPALFTVEYAMAQLWLSLGIEPVAMVGHSVGEFVAAHLAGTFELEDALRVVVERGRLMQAIPAGGMLAIRLGERELEPLLRGAGLTSLCVAALNGPLQSVVSGTLEDIARFGSALDAQGVANVRVATSHAFHSRMMEPVREPLARLIGGMRLAPPRLPFVSTVTGRWIESAEAVSSDYWAGHALLPVRFATALETLVESGVDVLLETGPGTALTSAARHGAAREAGCTVVASLPGDAAGECGGLLGALGRLWVAGATPDWRALHDAREPRRVALPAYAFQRKRHWLDNDSPVPVEITDVKGRLPDVAADGGATHLDVQRELAGLLEELSGERVEPEQFGASFLELGFDSLFLGRFVQQVNARYGVEVTFRQLLGDVPSLDVLATRIVAGGAPRAVATAAQPVAEAASQSTIENVVREQLAAMQQLMREQLAALGGNAPAPVTAPAPIAAPAAARNAESPARFDAFKIQAAGSGELTPAQRAHVEALIARVTAQTPKSKAYAQRYRAVLADPRVAAGFRAEWKEMVYPLVVERAAGSKLWDLDGNEYVDLLNGFGQTAFGHAPDFVLDAVGAQASRGFAIGPQSDLAGEVAETFCAMTGNERMTFCNTGSEAVMAALRVARTVTGRSRVVLFEGAYHGQFDEVLVKSARASQRSIAVAPGIPPEAVANVTVLSYATPESLAWIREHAGELAAVVVEPVQSRRPALQPKEFLQELREITAASGTALVFDEVVTGFRMHPGGMQAVFDIRADLATYGKVVGGGLPIGILAGTARFMDALDGGMWQYGDDSTPEVSPTFFAGTFVRHPLALASMLGVLRHLQARGPALQEALAARTAGLVGRLNAELERRGIASRIDAYGSMFYFDFAHDERLSSLLYYHLRLRGVYLQERFPCFLTTAHSEADIDGVVRAFGASLDELQAVGIFAAPVALPEAGALALPLTEAQTEIWLAAQLGDEASCAFNESITLRLRGALNVSALAGALDAVVARHEALRTAYGLTGETMRVLPALSVPLESVTLSAGGSEAAEAALAAYVERDARTPFDLVEGPLVRAALFELAGDDHALVLTAHHLVCDGWSMNVVLGELAEIYAARARGVEPHLREAPAFSAYARGAGRREPLAAAKIEAYWREQFAQRPLPLDLPTDRARPALRAFAGGTRSARIDADRAAAIKRAGAKRGCTLFVTLLSAFAALMGNLAKRRDVVVGIPAAGQALLDDANLVGHCVDFLPIRSAWNEDASFAELLDTVKRRVLDAYEHQSYTLGTLVRALELPRESDRVPLVEVQFNLERVADKLDFAGLDVEVSPNPKAFVNFDLFLNTIESDGGLRIDVDYNAKLFDAATIDRWLAAYAALLETIVTDCDTAVALLPAAPSAAAAQTAALSGPASAYPREATVQALFEAQVAARPNAIAAAFGADSLSYAALDERANRLAHQVLAASGGPGKLVGVALERSLEMLVALLAVLKAGCAYVPLDPKHPQLRLRHILADAGVAALVVDERGAAALAADGTPVVHVTRDAAAIAAQPANAPALERSATDLAYAIYTSGSTGVPKGVEIEHRAVVNLLEATAQRPGLGEHDIFVAVTTVAFDIAALELFLPLSVGAQVAIASADEAADGSALLRRLERARATAMQATPAGWRVLLEAGFRAGSGFKMLCGGEALRPDLAERLLRGEGELWNMYGPTETTIWSACGRILDASAISAGTPLANTQVYVLDDADRLTARDAIGHLHIGGDGVARGYVRQPELTAQKFIANPFGPGRLYRTGDRARITAAGEIEIRGRNDDQVKLRGYRIELGEIETALAQSGKLAAAAVALREDVPGSPRLTAYYVSLPGADVSPAELHDALAERLPEYMLPSAWVRLDALPVSPNGKLDRGALPAPPPVLREAGPEPLTATERALARICQEVLRLERLSSDDDLFALGADSIQLFQITARANRDGLRVAAKQVFAHRTIGALARQLDLAREEVHAG